MKNQEVITFKVSGELKKVLAGIENRSEFIRNAILNALEEVCPFCKGTGVLNQHRKEHWNELVASHEMHECGECKDFVLSCKK